VAARAGSNILAACRCHQIGNPVAGQVKRLEPLDAENARRGCWSPRGQPLGQA
jgi:hypothetical protein